MKTLLKASLLLLLAVSAKAEFFSPGGASYTPSFLGYIDGPSANHVGTSSNVIICPFDVPVPVVVTGIQYFKIAGGTNGNQINFGIYDSAGAVIVSTGPVGDGAGSSRVSLTIPTTSLSPGRYYYGFQSSSVSSTYGGTTPNGGNGTNLCGQLADTDMVLPTQLTIPPANSLRMILLKIIVQGGAT